MEFDEYEYLEKAVEEEQEERDWPRRRKEGSGNEKSERSYRKRDGEREEEDGDEERGSSRSKRSRGDGEENGGGRRDRDKDRHRSSRDRDRDRDRDKERDRERDREGEREKDRDRERSSRERDRKERDKEKDRDRERREREREREKERERREKERERERRSSSRSRGEQRERELESKESRRYKDKKETVQPEADPERDQRTVFAYQMPLKATERDVYEFFSKAGKDSINLRILSYEAPPNPGEKAVSVSPKVRDVRLIMDRNSRRSKGVGYIEFYDVMSVPMAIALSGQLLLGQPVMVKPSEAEKNLVQSNTSSGGAGGTGPVDRKLYVGNLHFNMTELQLRQIFEPFGPVELVQLPLDLETGQCKGFGFIQFAQLEHAKAAQNALNGKLEIAGRTIKVSSVTDHVGTQDAAPKSADFDDDDGGGLALNAQSRALLMQKLDRSGIATSIAGSLGIPSLNGAAVNQPGINLPIGGHPTFPASVLPTAVIPSPAIEPVGQPSECLLLKNMFDPAAETEPEFDLDIKDDVEEECSKYGRVKHISVDKNSAGFVYLRFESVQAAAAAQRAMHMRWFARRMISAIFMQPHEYEAKFKA